MRLLFRTAVYFVLITFVLSLGDWPFVDEILTEQTHLQQEALVALQTGVDLPSAAERTSKGHTAGSHYHSLVNFIDMPRHVIPSIIEKRLPGYLPEVMRFASVMLDPFDRPPSLSLS